MESAKKETRSLKRNFRITPSLDKKIVDFLSLPENETISYSDVVFLSLRDFMQNSKKTSSNNKKRVKV